MARLPNQYDLSGPGSFRIAGDKGRGIVRASDFGAEEVADATARLGRSIQATGANLADAGKEDQALDLIRADAHYKTSMLDVDRSFDNDPNYQTYDTRFQDSAKKITDTAGGLIRDPKLRERWLLQKQVETAGVRDRVLTKGDKRRQEVRFVALGDALQQHVRIFTDPSVDPERRNSALNDIRVGILTAERAGTLSPVQAQKFRETFVNGALIDEATNRLQTEPDALLRDLTTAAPLDTDINPETRSTGARTGRAQRGRKVNRFAPAVNSAINEAAAAEGVDPGLMGVFAQIESSGRPDVVTGSYKGLFQLSDEEFSQHGNGDVFNVRDNAAAAARKISRESAAFEEKYGRQPSALDLYMIHQQGEGGYANHAANPDAPAWQNMAATAEGRQKGERWAKQAIWGNIPDDMKARFGDVENVTSREFFQLWAERIERFGGDPGPIATEPRGRYADLPPGARIQLIQKANERVEELREEAADRRRAEMLLTGQMPIDPYSKEDQAVVDKAFKTTGLQDQLINGDPLAAAQVTQLAQNTGYVPEAALSQMRALSVNGSPEQKTYAYETAANLIRVKPGALDASEKSRRLKDDAEMYATLTTEMGLPATQAIQRIDELRAPEFEKRRDALKKEVDTFLKEITPDEVTSDYAGWFSSPELGGSPREKGVILDTYRSLVRDHYIRTGDPEVARSMAKKDLHRTYNVSNATGKQRLMRHPPEMHYPAIEPRAGKDPDHSYFTEQLQGAVNDYVLGPVREFTQDNPETRGLTMSNLPAEIPIEDIFIEAIPQTNMDIRSGRMPGYGVVWFRDNNGVRVMETAPGMVFRADVKAAREREQRNREERTRYARQKEIDRQARIENDPARRFVRGVQERLANPDIPGGDAPSIAIEP